MVGAKGGGPKGGAQKGGSPKFRVFLFLPLEISLFVLSLGVFSWNFDGV